MHNIQCSEIKRLTHLFIYLLCIYLLIHTAINSAEMFDPV